MRAAPFQQRTDAHNQKLAGFCGTISFKKAVLDSPDGVRLVAGHNPPQRLLAKAMAYLEPPSAFNFSQN